MTIHNTTSTLEMTGPPESADEFSMDIVKQIQPHVDFLAFVHEAGVTQQVAVESLRRYRDLWLPLVAKSYEKSGGRSMDLTPPPDIAWIWHCHRLAPQAYKKYIQQEFASNKKEQKDPKSTILDMQDPTAPYDCTTNFHTQLLWERTYPDEPFQLGVAHPMIPTAEHQQYKIIGGFDLVTCCQTQSTFLYQVMDLVASTETSKRRYVYEYRRFLELHRRFPEQTLVPTYEIDLAWHTLRRGCDLRGVWIREHPGRIRERTGGDVDHVADRDHRERRHLHNH